MNLRIGVRGPGQRMNFRERAMWAWNLQKHVARITGISRWGPALKGKLEIEHDDVLAIVLREAKSSFNRKSLDPVPYDRIPDDLIYELGSSMSFSGPFSITYYSGADPGGQYHKHADRTVSILFIDEERITHDILMELFIFLIRSLSATEAQYDSKFYSDFFQDKINVRVQDAGQEKMFRHKWTGLFTFLPDQLLTGFDFSEHNYTRVDGNGVIISMEGVEDTTRIMSFNKKIAALYGTMIG